MDVLPSMPKGKTVGNVFIDGKGDEKGGAEEARREVAEATKREASSSIGQGAETSS